MTKVYGVSDWRGSESRKQLLAATQALSLRTHAAPGLRAASREVAQGDIHVTIGMSHNGQHSTLQPNAGSETMCVYKHTANSADDKGNLATIAIHIPANEERPMQMQKGQSDAKS